MRFSIDGNNSDRCRITYRLRDVVVYEG